MREWEYVAGVALFGLAKLVAGVGAVAGIAWGLYSFHVTTLGWGLIPITAILLVVGWLVALFVIGLVLRYGSGAEALAWGILFVIMPLSGVFYPRELAARGAAARSPRRCRRRTRSPQDARWPPATPCRGTSSGWPPATTVALTAVAFAYLVWMLRIFRRRGYVTRYS